MAEMARANPASRFRRRIHGDRERIEEFPRPSDAQNRPIRAATADQRPIIEAAPNGGTVCGYQEHFAPLAAWQSRLRPRREVGRAVYLCIAALQVNVLNCRISSVFDHQIHGQSRPTSLRGSQVVHSDPSLAACSIPWVCQSPKLTPEPWIFQSLRPFAVRPTTAAAAALGLANT